MCVVQCTTRELISIPIRFTTHRPDNEWIKFNEAAATSGFGRDGAAIDMADVMSGGGSSSSAAADAAQAQLTRGVSPMANSRGFGK